MKKTILRYGMRSAAVLGITALINFFIFRNHHDYSKEEAAGYASIILSLVFVYFGIKHYRDTVGGGTVTYGRAFKVGLLIVLFPAIAFGVFDILYIKILDPQCMDRHFAYYADQMRVTLSPEKFQAKIAEMNAQKAMFNNIFFQFALMAVTVLLIGIVITAISSLILHKKPSR